MTPGATSQLVICGLGGQGILFMAKLLAEAAMVEGCEVIVSETHGMAQRGGAVESHVKIGPFQSPLVRLGHADLTLALDASRTEAARAYGKPESACLVNAATAAAAKDGPTRHIAASAVAAEMGYARGANLVLVGYAAAAWPEALPSREALLAAIDKLSPPVALKANREALLKGCELATKRPASRPRPSRRPGPASKSRPKR